LNQVDVDLHAQGMEKNLIDYNLTQASNTLTQVAGFAKIFAKGDLMEDVLKAAEPKAAVPDWMME
jgi:hypothetical protein